MRMRLVAAVFSIMLLAWTGSVTNSGAAAGAEGEAAARAVVDTAIKKLLAVLADPGLSDVQRLASVETIVRERFDIAETARLALGKSKSRFSPAQSSRYACEFEPYLSNYIGSRLERYQDEKVQILSAKRSKSHVIVQTKIVGGEFDQALVDFRMRETGRQWHAIDVTFEGVSVVRNFRAQFKEVLSAGGPDRLLELLKEKNGSRSDC